MIGTGRWLILFVVVMFTAFAGVAQEPSSSSPDSDSAASPEISSRRDAVHFGENIAVHEDDAVRDAVCFFCSVEGAGDMRDIVVFFGNAKLAGSARDVVVFGGAVRLGSQATTHDVVLMGGRLFAAPGSAIRGDRVVFPPVFLLIPLLGLALLVWLVVMLLRWLFTRNPRRVVYVAPRT